MSVDRSSEAKSFERIKDFEALSVRKVRLKSETYICRIWCLSHDAPRLRLFRITSFVAPWMQSSRLEAMVIGQG